MAHSNWTIFKNKLKIADFKQLKLFVSRHVILSPLSAVNLGSDCSRGCFVVGGF